MLRRLFRWLSYALVFGFLVIAGYLVLMSGVFHKPESYYAAAAYQPIGGKILVVGGTRNTGLEIIRELKARGEQVVAMVRKTSNTDALETLGIETVVADAMVPEQVRAAIVPGEYAAVVSSMGTSVADLPQRQNALTALVKGQTKMDPNKRPDFVGNKNVIDAAVAAGVKTFLLVTVIGAGDSADAVPLPARRSHQSVTPLKTQAEAYLRDSGLDYLIVRPGGLGPKVLAATGEARLTEDAGAFSYMSRIDLARLCVAALGDPKAYNQTFTAYDPQRLFLWNLFID